MKSHATVVFEFSAHDIGTVVRAKTARRPLHSAMQWGGP